MRVSSGLWGVVNNAGTMNLVAPPDWLSAEDYRRQCEVNLFGLIDVTMTFLPLVKQTGGRIVNVSSNFGLTSCPIFAPYSVSKFGIEAFTDAMRYRVAFCTHLSRCSTGVLHYKLVLDTVFVSSWR